MPLLLGARQVAWVKAALFAACLVPMAHLVYGGYRDTLGANPVEAVTRSTGWWTLFLLTATLAVTPLRRISGMNWLLRLRRMLGLYVFFYGLAHFLTFVWFDHWFDVEAILKDVVKRPFVTVGFAAFVLLVPLAITSNNAMVRRLGRNWQRLHRAVYAIAVLGVLHYWWLVKRDLTEPLAFALALALLLGMRLSRARGGPGSGPADSRTPAGPPVTAAPARR